MRIKCPFCGEREVGEYAYLGAADIKRPDPKSADAQARFFDAVYLRDNPAGPDAELWFHRAGCQSWLRVVRDTRTHEILEIGFASTASTTSSASSSEWHR